MPRQGPANGRPHCGPHSYVWPGLLVYAGCPSLAPLPTAHFYRVSALVRRCKEGLAPPYLRELCCSTVTIQRRISLRSSAQAQLLVPTVIRCAFSVAGSAAWNGLPVALRLMQVSHSISFWP